MPLNETDKAWIKVEIQNAAKRNGWGKLGGFIKDWGGVGAAVAVLALVLNQWGSVREFQGRTTAKLEDMEKRLSKLETAPYEKRLQQLLTDPPSQENAERFRKIFSQARANEVRIDAGYLRNAAMKFLQPSADFPSAWDTAMEFLAYRSFVNESVAPRLQATVDCSATYGPMLLLDFSALGSKPVSEPTVTVECMRGKNLSPMETARLDVMDIDYKNAPQIPESQRVHPPKANTEIAFYQITVAQGIALQMGHTHMKNVIVKDTTVVYDLDDSLFLENVWFVNCEFKLTQGDKSRKFSTAILAPGPVNIDLRYGN